jgi:hypothetical protein
MIDDITMNFRRVMPLLATLLAALWLIVSYTGIIPEDNFGYNELFAIFLVEVMIFFFAVLCAVLSAWKVLPWVFTGSLFSVGPLHYWGAGVNAPATSSSFLLSSPFWQLPFGPFSPPSPKPADLRAECPADPYYFPTSPSATFPASSKSCPVEAIFPAASITTYVGMPRTS